MEDMVTFYIYNDEKEDRMWELIVNLYDDILYKDFFWHFFWEGDHILLRTSEKFKESVREWLEESDYNIEFYKKFYSNTSDQPIVNRYFELFVYVFHLNSMFAIVLNDEEFLPSEHLLRLISDRINHSFFNNLYFINGRACEETRVVDPEFLEGYLLTEVARDRMFHHGIRHQYKRSPKKEDEKEKEKNEKS